MATIARTPCDEGVILGGKGRAACARSAEPWVLAATILGSSMGFIDGTAVNVALPALQKDLGATVAEVQWVVEAYALFLSALLLVGGALGDRFGRRRVFLTGVAGFALASAWCGLAPDTGQLIAARAFQGIAAALMVPGSLALLSASFEKERRGRAIGTWSGFGAITAAVGPLVGGWLIDQASCASLIGARIATNSPTNSRRPATTSTPSSWATRERRWSAMSSSTCSTAARIRRPRHYR